VLGAGVLARMRANEAIVGSDVVRAALSRLGRDLRAELEGLSSLSWIDLDTVERIQDAIALEAHRDPERLHDEAIRRAQEESIRTIYRIVLGLASDAWLVSRTQAMFSRTRKIGQLRSRIPRPGEAELVLTDWPNIRDRHARQVAIGVETLLSLTGRGNVNVSYTLHADGAHFSARWDPK
jgi:hypothetical protein